MALSIGAVGGVVGGGEDRADIDVWSESSGGKKHGGDVGQKTQKSNTEQCAQSSAHPECLAD